MLLRSDGRAALPSITDRRRGDDLESGRDEPAVEREDASRFDAVHQAMGHPSSRAESHPSGLELPVSE